MLFAWTLKLKLCGAVRSSCKGQKNIVPKRQREMGVDGARRTVHPASSRLISSLFHVVATFGVEDYEDYRKLLRLRVDLD